jgi:hypothetical protein
MNLFHAPSNDCYVVYFHNIVKSFASFGFSHPKMRCVLKKSQADAHSPFPSRDDGTLSDKLEPAMRLDVLDALFWIIGIRGHIP